MEVPFTNLKKQIASIRSEIDIAINDVIDSAAFIKGEAVSQFEESFSRLIGVSHTVAVGNGTDALFIALKAIGIGVGDEVITASNTFIATAEAITATGAKVVFADIKPDTFNIDTNLIEGLISRRTKAIVPVHIFGQIAEMDELFRLSEKYNLFIVEDAAQAHLAEYKLKNGKWKQAGTLSHIATFSFFPGKNLGAFGDAGAIVTNDIIFAKKARMFANHGRLTKFNHEIEGYNSRMDSIQAAVLNVKLNYITNWTNKRREIANLYIKLLSDIKQIQVPIFISNQKPAWHLFVILAKDRDDLKKYLNENGISTGIHYPTALPNLTAYQYLGHKPSDFPIASAYQKKILSLPFFPEMSLIQVEYVCNKIKEFYNT